MWVSVLPYGVRICPDCAATYAAEERFCPVDGAATLEVGNDPLIGRAVGSYKLVRMLGEGGMGQVYLGVHPGIGSRVAIKLLDSNAASRKDLIDRFFAEAMAVNRIRHENIVNVLDLDNLELPGGVTRPYIIMEHLEGRPLSSVLAHFGRLPQGTLIQMVREILGALSAAHNAGIIHRDLKPDNVFVSPQGRSKVLDFGIAKLLPNAALGEGANFTQTGMLLGTPSYMSPEQAKGEKVTFATDIYAVGVILYEAITGELPFHGETLYDLLNKHVTQVPRPPRLIDPSIHPALESVILRALAKSPQERYRSADEMAAALLAASHMLPAEAWASISLTGDEPALIATPTPRPTPSGGAIAPMDFAAQTPPVSAPKPRKSRGAILLAAALVAIVGVAAVAAVLAGGGGDETEPEVAAKTQTGEPPESLETTDTTRLAAADTTAGAGPADPGKTSAEEPTSAEKPAKKAPAKAEPTKSEPSRSEPAKSEPAKTEPAKTEPAKTEPAKTEPAKSEPAKKSGVIMISTADQAKKKGFKPFKQPAGVNTKQFDAVAFVPTAQKLARRLMSDAKLTEFEVSGVGPSGKSNLHRGYAEASFWFRSPSRSKGDPSLPRGAAGEDIACMVYVDVNNGTVEVYAVTREKCKDSFRRRPRCSLKQVWAKAYAKGAPKGNWVAKVTYDKGWFFDIADGEGEGDDFTESIPDDC